MMGDENKLNPSKRRKMTSSLEGSVSTVNIEKSILIKAKRNW